MGLTSILIANRGEIAIRIARAASDLGRRTVAVFSADDADSLHRRMADEARALPGRGSAAYLEMDAVIQAALESGCDAIHPGYGFLSERGEFARRCAAAGLTFIGPKVEHLELFGDKARAREAALAAGVPVSPGLDRSITLEEARAFLADRPPGQGVILKALAGGGGRGSRVVLDAEELEAAYARCRSEAQAAFGVPDVYVEAFLSRARHVEVQVLGDLAGEVTHLGERECSVQRRFQKIVEVAPAPGLDPALRRDIIEAALRLARSVGYSSLGTFEFLVDASGGHAGTPFVFIEANARLQVEHTVTEAITGVDLVQAQIRLAEGARLADLGLPDADAPPPRFAIQARVNLESLAPDGSVRPSSGVLAAYEAPSGPGVRTDGFGYAGYRTSTAFDSLLAKVIASADGADAGPAVARTLRALSEFRIEGVATNIGLLRNILRHPDFAAGAVHTRWLDENVATLAAGEAEAGPYAALSRKAGPDVSGGFAGARVDTRDPLALFRHDAEVRSAQAAAEPEPEPEAVGPDGSVGVGSPIQGTITAIDVAVGDAVQAGQQVAIVEAMKMEHVIAADRDGIVRAVTMAPGDVVREGYPIVFIEEAEVSGDRVQAQASVDPDFIRGDLRENLDRHAYTLDENRPEVVAKRHALGYRMVRESIDQLMDAGSFKEYWPLIVARQHRRHDI
ncbi:MAG: biotin carboxylase N-terminal domain-containing protein, partial [Phenylobacterium sp.]